jgi:hypothetical protein
MLIERQVTCYESYLPSRRHRIPRIRPVETTVKAELAEATLAEAPLAIRQRSIIPIDCGRTGNGRIRDFHWYQNRLYTLVRRRKFCCLYGKQRNRPGIVADLGTGYTSPSPTVEQQQEALERYLAEYLLIDGKLHIEIGEPRYVVMTFGLGCNHGGTALMEDNYYNPNIRKDRYYRIDRVKEAQQAAIDTAKRRGDTIDAARLEKGNFDKFEIFLPKCLKLDPQKEHGDGDPFINKVDAITEAAGHAGVAGMLVLAAAFSGD